MSFKCFFLILALAASLFSKVLAILVEAHPRNIPVKLFLNRSIGLGDVF